DLPRAALLAHGDLQVAAGHVEAHRVAEDVRVGLLDGNVRAAGTDRHHQLDLVLQVLRRGRVGRLGRLPGCTVDHRVGRLAKEERRPAVGIEAHFAGVRGIVAAHAVDAPHGELARVAVHGNGGRWEIEYGAHLWNRYLEAEKLTLFHTGGSLRSPDDRFPARMAPGVKREAGAPRRQSRAAAIPALPPQR